MYTKYLTSRLMLMSRSIFSSHRIEISHMQVLPAPNGNVQESVVLSADNVIFVIFCFDIENVVSAHINVFQTSIALGWLSAPCRFVGVGG